MSEKKELSDQTRAIIAAALSLIVIVGYSMFYKPGPPAPRTPNGTVAVGTTPGNTNVGTATGTSASGAPGSGNNSSTAPTMAAAIGARAAAVPAVAAAGEQKIVVDSALYHVELSNRGAVVHNWELTKYTDSSTPPQPLDLINAAVAQQSGGWPLAVLIPDAPSEAAANQGLYTVSVASQDASDEGPAKPAAAQTVSAAVTNLAAPAEIDFHWSDGHLEVTKQLKFDSSYVIELKTTVRRDGQLVDHRVAWNGGFGDVSAFRESVQTVVFTGNANSISTLATKKLGATGQPTVFVQAPGNFDSVGIEDLFFAAVFLPPLPAAGQPVPATLTLSTKQVEHDFNTDGKAQQEFLPAMAAGATSSGPLNMRVFVGPKDIDLMKSMRPPLNGLVNFGWFGFVAEPLFYSLRWMHRYVSNYGWDIIIITVVINMLLYPLKVKSWRGMQKMQKAAPEIKQIQDRYKKYSVRDPRKAEMNKEVMAVYAREGINPVGSCVPQLIQMPIWFGLYRMLNSTIELRHAPWILWVHDLSGNDPHYILTIIMGLLMYAAQKMTPMTASDPSQQRMMAIMPLMFVGMFFFIPVSTGLILYILTQNLVAVGQQWHLNKSSPLKAPPSNKLKKK